ncbi:hypothetical protein L9F63_017247 [Diploptera punctata]|uniref:Dolichyl-diphosphooligosaccharide--protein glycosyltransferase subunit 1 n=1 Tax=Diploptera punctata TaxID=6984 RepID=A0AAD8EGY7_DIPPU|nr:hypothetical protein L9F63_017247 [Diploptera punctata]
MLATFILIHLFALIYIARGQSVLINEDVKRTVDISSQIVDIKHDIIIFNDGNLPIKKFYFHIEKKMVSYLSYIDANSGGHKLQVKKVKKNKLEDIEYWEIKLKSVLKIGQRANVQVITDFTQVLIPYPTHIIQSESQLVKYIGNSYFYSPYFTKVQTTSIVCYSDKFESFTILEPVSVQNNVITYGPYENISPFSIQNLTIHYLNNGHFIVITNLERTIEVSHWGNIAVEEIVELHHTGALLKGSFSRIAYNQILRKPESDSSIPSYITILPASAKDIYYRDEIGNVSSSHVRIFNDRIHLHLKFRFPLYGGWKIRYTVGYNVPSFEYLYSNGYDYSLRMRIMDHVYDFMVVEELVTKVILPEHSGDIWLHPPFSMVHLPETKHFTYLDVVGRPVLTVAKNNLVEFHIQDFEVQYTFPKYMLLMEPLLLIVAIFIVLVMIVIINRIDFSIDRDHQQKKLKRKAFVSRHFKNK